MQTNILLESGTNELEILEFCVGDVHYGINVAKIKEILNYKAPTPVPNAHPAIEGIFMPRDEIITIINLAVSLNMNIPALPTDMYIVTNFNSLNVGFHVQKVVGIHRMSWAEISKPDATINNAGNGVATGIVKIDGRLVIILDFEKIVAEISPETGLRTSQVDAMINRGNNERPILIAEDSPLLNKLILDCLRKAGYANIKTTTNGQEAWDYLCEIKNSGNVKNNIALVVTDIEMPQMDGHHLTKLIKTDAALKDIPVIIFSSLINDEMRKKGEAVGADSQLTKPEIGLLVGEMDRLLQLKNA